MLLIILFGLLSGAALGITGSGGAIIAVPLLAYGIGLSAHDAILVSLASVFITAILGTLQRVRKRLVAYPEVGIMILGSIVGSPIGALLNHHFSERLLMILFSAMVLVIAGVTWHRIDRNHLQQTAIALKHQYYKLVFAGCITGVLTGLFGVGGGFLIVPVLVTIGRLPINKAMASSLAVISIASGISLLSHISSINIPLIKIMGLFLIGSILGMFIGYRVTQNMSVNNLQRLFAIFLALIGGYILFSNI